jgi:hypothetical protein
VLALGVLVFVVGSLLVLNVWAVIDAKLAVSAAAREGARAAAEASGSEADAAHAAAAAARAALSASGRQVDDERTDVSVETASADGLLERCERITVVVSHDVPTVPLPWLGDAWGSLVTVTSRHSEIVDPYRSGLVGAARCAP